MPSISALLDEQGHWFDVLDSANIHFMMLEIDPNSQNYRNVSKRIAENSSFNTLSTTGKGVRSSSTHNKDKEDAELDLDQ